jgi:hypothetical protein
VLALPPSWAQTWLDRQPDSGHIGWITSDSQQIIWNDTRLAVDSAGFDHFGSVS